MIDRLAGQTKGFVRTRLAAAELNRRQVPAFRTTTSSAGTPTVYYLAPDNPRPSGGVRVIYRHVDLLTELGVPAYVMHKEPGFRCTWFANRTPVIAAAAATLGPADILVVPEWYGPGLAAMPRGPRVVVFNQRAYDTFDHVPYADSGPGAPYAGLPGMTALLAVSQDNVDLLSYAFPDIPVRLTRNVVDPDVFAPGDWPRRRRIAYVGHRRADERDQLLHILRSRNVLDGWELTLIAGRTEEQTAQIMRDCALFLSFSDREGFGMPPAEAMSCGAYVVGYPGLAGREFFDPAHCAPVPDGDLLAFARAVEQACATWADEPEMLAKRAAAASSAIRDRYTVSGLRDDLTAFYQPLLAAG
ncbi:MULTISPECIES: glycosyltransferase [unclassified Solwaraspora]|uniref:glycosyltransferase n=1 Tax=unclassified Solwaraspora TaxID=2627926 RepID=UPI00259BCB08|nr:glycosyltransferase [Solwaraspora sp. WMMA2056]WJK42958.1 glycosyltransferase [Solwaraspora sp. WMMA2056]